MRRRMLNAKIASQITALQEAMKDPCLLTRLKKLIQKADSMEQPPTHNAVLHGLQGLLEKYGTATTAAEAKDTTKPPPANTTKYKLLQHPWGQAKVWSASSVKDRTFDPKMPPVVTCQNLEEYENAQRWFEARGKELPHAKYVLFGQEQIPAGWTEQDVPVEHASGGATKVKALVRKWGDHAPTRRGLPGGVKDDQVEDAPTAKPIAFRITVAREFFTEDWLWAQASSKPVAVGGLIFNAPTAKMLLQTKGAVGYRTEVTAILLVAPDNKNKFLEHAHPEGVFLNQQASPLVPVWHRVRDQESMASYYARVSGVAKTSEGRLVYRPSDNSSLGVLSKKVIAANIQPRWTLQNTPLSWSDADTVSSWDTQRGFKNVSGVVRCGARRWFPRGDVEALEKDRVLELRPGIMASVAAPRRQTRAPPPGKSATAWGAPSPDRSGDIVKEEDEHKEVHGSSPGGGKGPKFLAKAFFDKQRGARRPGLVYSVQAGVTSTSLEQGSAQYPGYIHAECGWKPDLENQTANSIRGQARSHWRRCQGLELPQELADTRKLRYHVTLVAAMSQGKRDMAWKNVSKWWDDHPPDIKEVSCEINEASCHAIQRATMRQTYYTCSKCGKNTCLSRVKSIPCKGRPAGNSFKDAMARKVGAAKTEHFHQRRYKQVKMSWKKRATREPDDYKEYYAQYGRKPYARRKALGLIPTRQRKILTKSELQALNARRRERCAARKAAAAATSSS
ncbi:unnamed protein product [Prorocentrum cordatum]|uniref:Uncharacterized protein n=1 Tax=Prorocentrum cordatum TaxID=2364126 RepID=A0ABN9PQH7_9DINO|nr:unnamed protein product [Polarella glacialis]